MEVVDSFRSKKPLVEMMSFLLGLPEAHLHLTPAECRWEEEKNANAAEHYRALGNALYDRRLTAQALQMFSTSILLAPHPPRRPYPAAGEKESLGGSETPFPPFSTEEEEEDEGKQVLSLAYANRSAMLLELKRYPACLRDIGLALRFGYPKRLRYKLVSRWARCLIALDREKEAVALLDAALEGLGSLPCDELTLANAKVSLLMVRQLCRKAASSSKGSPSFSLSAPALAKEREFKVPKLKNENRSAPALSSAVKVAYTRAKGRHLVATRDINPGELLCVEKSFATVLDSEVMGICSHCLADHKGIVIPCPECTVVMFCSLECQQEALSSYHRVECPIGPNLTGLGLPAHVLLALRIVTKMSFKKLKKADLQLRKEVETRKPATLGLNGEDKYVSSYRSVYHLNTNQAQRPDLDLFNACVVAFVLLKLLQKSGRFFCGEEGQPCTPSHEDLVLVGTALCSHVLRATCNGLTIMNHTRVLEKTLHVEIGLGLFPTLSLANHSCDPTATVLTYQTGSLMMSLSFIQKGGEVTRSYGVSHLHMERKERRALLQEGYHFLCDCRACKGDWPLFKDISNSLTLICLKCSQPLCPLSLQCRNCKIDYNKPLTKKEAKVSNRYFWMEILHKVETAKLEFAFSANPPVNYDEDEKKVICDMLRLLAKYTKHPTKIVHAVRNSLDLWLMFWAPANYFR